MFQALIVYTEGSIAPFHTQATAVVRYLRGGSERQRQRGLAHRNYGLHTSDMIRPMMHCVNLSETVG